MQQPHQIQSANIQDRRSLTTAHSLQNKIQWIELELNMNLEMGLQNKTNVCQFILA